MARNVPASDRPAVAALRDRRLRMRRAREERAERKRHAREDAARKRKEAKHYARDVAAAVRHTALKLETDRASFAADLAAAKARSLLTGKSLLLLTFAAATAAASSTVIAHYARAPLPLDQAFATMPLLLAGYIVAAFAAWYWLSDVLAPWWMRKDAEIMAARMLTRTDRRASALEAGDYIAAQSLMRAGRWPDTPLEIRFPSDQE
ncbi:hypothetical protein FHS51_003415 [Sphingobium wenxiniae]|jgi:hypothetical protein|uniref:Uncharacterized protein n=1 Tax=Sphingobium wenxiniae (strain DSM 21828 / CGMCC 1.7748 / JZ-1) TaxID=595605 RepID=A0A562K8R4_SPHWJ|nr:hypothetical protein [Sphingobium wenxiniae]MBB6193159.1 hypothetical protein [Sphingobium wenxiniae]MBE5074950.1 hypothetical protein [Erythrobacteraceae bacterium E2-1 Yellow Sea]TWH91605.1 hypothetical protein IQ35_03118 [Sphingobium wenxiniae]